MGVCFYATRSLSLRRGQSRSTDHDLFRMHRNRDSLQGSLLKRPKYIDGHYSVNMESAVSVQELADIYQFKYFLETRVDSARLLTEEYLSSCLPIRKNLTPSICHRRKHVLSVLSSLSIPIQHPTGVSLLGAQSCIKSIGLSALI